MGNYVNRAFNVKKGQMSDHYDPPERVGNNPFTRSGKPPPKLAPKGGSENPSHRIYDPMSLELHMADERVRTRGLSAAEREYRHQYLKDQHLHPDEPVHVDAVHRQLNPVRRLYRWPMDTLYIRFLRPTFGTMKGSVIRVMIPKIFFTFCVMEYLYYVWKYEDKDWQRKSGVVTFREQNFIPNYDEIEKIHPGLVEKAHPSIERDDYYHPSYSTREALVGDKLGETPRPW